jgi:hypothetical protein
MALRARPANGFATLWDRLSGTRVVIEPKGAERPPVEAIPRPEGPVEDARRLGPYQVLEELVPGRWLGGTDPVLRRPVWLLRRNADGPSATRRGLARPGRLRWLQKVEDQGATWDAFEASPGAPFAALAAGERRLPWARLRHWLHDLASELWAASKDGTLPAELSLDHVWITTRGQALLLDEAWPEAEAPAERFPVGDVAGQQRFLSAVAARAEATGLPLHARPALRNLEEGRFEKLSFLTGNLQGLLERPAEVGRGIRAGSIFLLPLYVGIMVFVGVYSGEGRLPEALGGSATRLALGAALIVLAGSALVELLMLPLRTTPGHSVFRLAVVDADGRLAGGPGLFLRWAIVWLPLLLPLAPLVPMLRRGEPLALALALVLLLLWIGAAVHTALHPRRGWHDRLVGTWVVRR